MVNVFEKNNSTVDGKISRRTGVGPNSLVEGWQAVIVSLLEQMKPYLKTGRIVTFQNLTNSEKIMFEKIASSLDIPDCACGLFLPFSVRNQIMYVNRGMEIPPQALNETDDGVIIVCRCDFQSTIINALLAKPPYAAAVDVYENGALIAGYVYSSVEDCLYSMGEVVRTYFDRGCPPF